MQKQMWIVCLAAASVGLGGFSSYAGVADAQHRSAPAFKSFSCDDDEKPDNKGKSARDDEEKPEHKQKRHEEPDEEKGEHKGKPGKGDGPDHKGKHEKDEDEKEEKDHGKHREKAVSEETVERLLVQIDEVREELDKLEKQVIELKGDDEDHPKGDKDEEDKGPKHHRHHEQDDKD